jgi:AbiV family abortive infection protein
MTLDWNRFWKAWTSHDDKNQFMIFNLLFDRMRSDHVDPEAPWEPLSSSEEAAALQAMPSVFAALAEQMNMTLPQYKALQKKRLAATYVDFRDGRVADPKTVATEDEVSSFVTAARSLIDWEQLAWANRAPFQDMLPDFAKQVLVEVEKSFASPPAPPE